MKDGALIFVAGLLMAGAVAGSVAAARLRVPALILFLGVGMAAGSDGAGLVQFDDYEVARRIGIVALALILFDGGLRTGISVIRPVLWPSLALAIGGTVITAIVTGVAATFLFGLPPSTGLLLGSILASTDGAAVFGLLRESALRRRLTWTLEGESGFNDPVAVLLVLGLIALMQQPSYGLPDFAVLFAKQLAIGALCGGLVAVAGAAALSRVRLPRAGLYPVASLALALSAFGSADTFGGSGFLAVYLAGLLLSDSGVPARETMAIFHDGLAWLAQVALFLTLGLLVSPAELESVWRESIVLALVLMFVARPVAVLATTVFERFSRAERVILIWAGLRGAIPVVLATFPVTAGIGGSPQFFNIVFFAVVLSTVLQGMTFEPLAQSLGLTAIAPVLPRPLADSGTIRGLGAEVVEFAVRPGDGIVGRRIRELGLPDGATVSVIVRGRQALPPHGSTRLAAGDVLHLLSREESRDELAIRLDHWRDASWEPARETRRPTGDRARSLSTHPWAEQDGDASDPELVVGVPVTGRILRRFDAAGALVALADGRYALTGATAVVGSADDVRRYLRRRLASPGDDNESVWWLNALAALRG